MEYVSYQSAGVRGWEWQSRLQMQRKALVTTVSTEEPGWKERSEQMGDHKPFLLETKKWHIFKVIGMVERSPLV